MLGTYFYSDPKSVTTDQFVIINIILAILEKSFVEYVDHQLISHSLAVAFTSETP